MNNRTLFVAAAMFASAAANAPAQQSLWEDVGTSVVTPGSVNDPFLSIHPATNKPLAVVQPSYLSPPAGRGYSWDGLQWSAMGGNAAYSTSWYHITTYYHLAGGQVVPMVFVRDYGAGGAAGGDGIVAYHDPLAGMWMKSPTAASTGGFENAAHDVWVDVNTTLSTPKYNRVFVAYADRTTNPTAGQGWPVCASTPVPPCFDPNQDDLTVQEYHPSTGTFTLLGGNRGITGTGIYHASIDVGDDGTIYVGYRTGAAGLINVIKYDDATDSFSPVGPVNFAVGGNTMMKLDKYGVPHVAYVIGANVIVRKFDSAAGAWVQVGPVVHANSGGGQGGWRHRVQLAFTSGNEVVVAYTLRNIGGQQNKLWVRKYDAQSNTWRSIGPDGFSPGHAYGVTLAIDSHDVPYVGYIDATQYNWMAAKGYAPVMSVTSNPAPIGSTVTFDLQDPIDAGKPYIFLASLGSSPGIPLDDRTVPLNDDFVLQAMLSDPWSIGFSNTFGSLDANGNAQVTWSVPNVPQISGVQVTFSYVTYTPAGITSPDSIKSIARPMVVTLQ